LLEKEDRGGVRTSRTGPNYDAKLAKLEQRIKENAKERKKEEREQRER